MMSKHLTVSEIEDIYDALAVAIDDAGRDREPVLLAKLALVMANMIGDRDRVLEAISISARDL